MVNGHKKVQLCLKTSIHTKIRNSTEHWTQHRNEHGNSASARTKRNLLQSGPGESRLPCICLINMSTQSRYLVGTPRSTKNCYVTAAVWCNCNAACKAWLRGETTSASELFFRGRRGRQYAPPKRRKISTGLQI